jgi:bleomycin hydrolase
VPDNWSMGQAYNVKLDDLISIIENSINNGYTVAATIDNTEKGFDWNKGIARVSSDGNIETESEPKITPQMRQKAFDEYQTTDDHSILIIGSALSNNGDRYFLAKNSWGTENTAFGGYLYVSEAYIRYKVLTILVNKSGVPGDIIMQYNNTCN